ncbi:CHASE domain-containing protein [Mesorhizobium sp. 131-2-1]|uniref:CHASE domain-containing protein n=2 Tax=unclassified Mesorhizobium TaxID=325217 RepID=UPI0019262B2F|nr:CHASE domain-containing protein [Mesorhizobium sp. 131-2-1]
MSRLVMMLHPMQRLLSHALAKIVVVAALYYLTGQLGLLLAVPPGYATIIWPASGIAVGALIAYGRSLWPGIFVGSLALNAVIGGGYSAETGWAFDKLAIAAAIAAGSTAQALVARWLVGRVVGIPIDLRGMRDIIAPLLAAGPVSCVVAPTVGVTSLYLAGVVPSAGVAHNWLTWWSGDVLGIVIFLPIVLIAPGAERQLSWRGTPLGTLPIAAILTLLLPLGLTFYGWKATNQFIYDRNSAIFASMAIENEQALMHRLASYDQALLGGVDFFEGSSYVSADEWRSYVDVLDLKRSMPGVNGIGYIENVPAEKVSDFLFRVQKAQPQFTIHPDVPGGPRIIITYIEPLAPNRPALGLNIAFESNRLEGATLSRDTGKPAITRRIVLVQDQTKSNGFILLHPMYRKNVPLGSVDERRAALTGWIYAPFVAQKFMSGLTTSEDRSLTLQVYDGDGEDADALIYQSGEPNASAPAPAFSIRKQVDVMQQRWTLSWHSTPAFEQSVASQEPLLVLASGIVFTALFGVLLSLFAHRAETIKVLVDRKTSELAEREALYRLLAENTSDMISRVAFDGTRLYTSPACLRLLGYTAEELQNSNAFSDVHPKQRSRLQAEYARLARGEIDESKGVFTLHRKDDDWVQAEITLQLVRDRAGNPAELVVTERDVTLQEQRAEELKLARAEAEVAKMNAEQASEAKTAFLATMSHEIRTPLNGVIGYGDLLLSSNELSEQNRRYAERIGTSAAALLTVVNDILDFSRIEAGQVEIDAHPFSLGALIDNALSIVGGVATRKGLALVRQVDPTLPPRLVGDQDRLRQVLLNLLNNAVKFTATGTVTLAVDRIGDSGAGPVGLRFAVRDTGIGISAEQQDRLFQRFSQVDGSIRREFGGSGLGLAISKRLVGLMGGRIGVDSTAGEGSLFWFEVALAEATSDAEPSRFVEAMNETRAPARILLVEDMEINRDIASAVLRSHGHEVDIAVDGTEAIAAIQNRTYDVVLMDVQMPVMDGLSATRHIRALNPPVRDIPIVALTANVLPFQLAELRAAGMTDHVGKPFKQAELLAAIVRNTGSGPDRHVGEPGPAATGGRDFNADVFGNLETVLGKNRVEKLLDKLADVLRTRLVSISPDTIELDVVQRDAHSLVSSSGMLGFEALSNLCRDIETSCIAGTDLMPALQRFERARDAALNKIEALKSAV